MPGLKYALKVVGLQDLGTGTTRVELEPTIRQTGKEVPTEFPTEVHIQFTISDEFAPPMGKRFELQGLETVNCLELRPAQPLRGD